MPLDLDIQLSIYELNILLLFSMDHEYYYCFLWIMKLIPTG